MPGKSGSRKQGRNTQKCSEYLSSRQRIKNKKRELEKRISVRKPEAGKNIREACPIGRLREKGGI